MLYDEYHYQKFAHIEESRINEAYGYERYSFAHPHKSIYYNIHIKNKDGKNIGHLYDGLTIAEVYFVYIGILLGMRELLSNETLYKVKLLNK